MSWVWSPKITQQGTGSFVQSSTQQALSQIVQSPHGSCVPLVNRRDGLGEMEGLEFGLRREQDMPLRH